MWYDKNMTHTVIITQMYDQNKDLLKIEFSSDGKETIEQTIPAPKKNGKVLYLGSESEPETHEVFLSFFKKNMEKMFPGVPLKEIGFYNMIKENYMDWEKRRGAANG